MCNLQGHIIIKISPTPQQPITTSNSSGRQGWSSIHGGMFTSSVLGRSGAGSRRHFVCECQGLSVWKAVLHSTRPHPLALPFLHFLVSHASWRVSVILFVVEVIRMITGEGRGDITVLRILLMLSQTNYLVISSETEGLLDQ